MKESIIERNKRLGVDRKIADFMTKQKQPYEFKVRYAELRAWEFYEECGRRDLNTHVSVGGLDSITLLVFLRKIGINVPAISVSALEDKSIQAVHKALARALNPNEETDQANICEEIADVSILLDQMYLHFGKEYIMRLKLSTLKRLKERMDAEDCAEDEEESENRIKECRSSFVEALKGLEKAFDEALGL